MTDRERANTKRVLFEGMEDSDYSHCYDTAAA